MTDNRTVDDTLQEEPYVVYRNQPTSFHTWLFRGFLLFAIGMFVTRITLIVEGRGLHAWRLDLTVYLITLIWYFYERRLSRGFSITLRLSGIALTMTKTGSVPWFDRLQNWLFHRSSIRSSDSNSSAVVSHFARSDVVAMAVDRVRRSLSTTSETTQNIVFVSLRNRYQKKLFFLDEVIHERGMLLSQFIKRVNEWAGAKEMDPGEG